MPLDAHKYLEAQDNYGYARICDELRNEAKEGHWIWFVFPQIAGLGKSFESEYYALAGLDEAREYLANATLRARLLAAALIIGSAQAEVSDIVGHLDKLKIRSSLTLFELADTNDAVWADVLDDKFDGERDPWTLDLAVWL